MEVIHSSRVQNGWIFFHSGCYEWEAVGINGFHSKKICRTFWRNALFREES